MALGQIRQDYQPIPLPREAGPCGVDVSGFDPAPSPALQLQQRLAQSVAPPTEKKWPPYQSLALIVTASAALWMALLMSGAQAVRVVQPLIA